MGDSQQKYTSVPCINLEISENSNESVSVIEPLPNKYSNKNLSKQFNCDLHEKHDEISVPVTGSENEFRIIHLTQIGTLHYKALQAVAFNMNLPANVKRKELMALIVARKTGKEHIVNRILAEVVKDRAYRREKLKQQPRKHKSRIKNLNNITNRYALNVPLQPEYSNVSPLENSKSDISKNGPKRPIRSATVTSIPPEDLNSDPHSRKRRKLDNKSESIVEILDSTDEDTTVKNRENLDVSEDLWCLQYCHRNITTCTYTYIQTRFIVMMTPETCVVPWYHAPVMTSRVQQSVFRIRYVPQINSDEEEQVPEELRNIYYDLLQDYDLNYNQFKDALGNRDINKILDFIMCTEAQLEDYNRQLHHISEERQIEAPSSLQQELKIEEPESEVDVPSAKFAAANEINDTDEQTLNETNMIQVPLFNNIYAPSLNKIEYVDKITVTQANITCRTEVVYCLQYYAVSAGSHYVLPQNYPKNIVENYTSTLNGTGTINTPCVEYVLRQIPSIIYDNLTGNFSPLIPQACNTSSEFIDFSNLSANPVLNSVQLCNIKQADFSQTPTGLAKTFEEYVNRKDIMNNNENNASNMNGYTNNSYMMEYLEETNRMATATSESTTQPGFSSTDPYDSTSTSRGAPRSKNLDYTELRLKERESPNDYTDLDHINVTCNFFPRYEDILPYIDDFSDVTFHNINTYEDKLVSHHKNKCERLQIQCPFLFTLCYWFEFVPLMPIHIRKMHPEKIVRKGLAQYDINYVYLATLRRTGVKIIQEVKNHMYFISLSYYNALIYITIQEVCETDLQHANRTMARLAVRHQFGMENWMGLTNSMDVPLSQLWNTQTSLVLTPHSPHRFTNKHFTLFVEIDI